MRLRPALALTALLVAATAGAASAAAGDPGLGSAVDVVSVTPTAGPLSIAGAGLAVGTPANQAPGAFGSAVGGGGIVVSDLRLSNAGWYVTATYSDPVAGLALGAANVQVSTSNVVPDAVQGGVAPSNVNLVTDQVLTTPVTVASTKGDVTTPISGAGITLIHTAYKLRVPATASATGAYAGTVTYTVASAR
jgi:hypothetical protein